MGTYEVLIVWLTFVLAFEGLGQLIVILWASWKARDFLNVN